MKKSILIAAASLLAFVACNKGPSETVTVTAAGNATTVAIGAELALTAKAQKDGKDVAEAKFAWKTSDETLATVAADGKVKGVKAGEVTITATSDQGGKPNGTIKLKVVSPTTN